MSAPLPVDILVESVIRPGLCARCGTCVGVCPAGNLSIDDPMGDCVPVPHDLCTACGMCLAGCPGAEVDFLEHEARLFGASQRHPLLGVVRSRYLAHAVDPLIRRKGSSGGVVTALLLDLLARGEAEAAALFAPHPAESWRGWGRIVREPGEIVASAQSRYHLSPLNTALGEVAGARGGIAYVGLPCQVHGLRKLEQAGWGPARRIRPVIGVYCGNNLYYEGTRTMLRKLGVKNVGEISSLSYREGKWPGSFAVTTRDGRTKSISKLEFNQVIPFYVNRRCLFCIDLTNELADISVGDGWAKEGTGDEGWAVLLARTPLGEAIVENAGRAGILHLEAISEEEAARMHAHAFDLKKTGAFLRLSLWKQWGRPVPRYDLPAPAVGVGRRLVEHLVSAQFVLCGSAAGRALFRAAPRRLLGAFFRWARKGWMATAARR